MSTPVDLNKLQEAMQNFLQGQEFNYMLTLNFNETMRENVARRLLGKFLQRMDRKILGPRYIELPDRRLRGIAFYENPTSNSHWHCLCRVEPKLARLQTLVVYSDDVWESLWKRGQAHIQRIRGGRVPEISSGKKRVVGYVLKQLKLPGSFERFVFFNDFWSARPALKR